MWQHTRQQQQCRRWRAGSNITVRYVAWHCEMCTYLDRATVSPQPLENASNVARIVQSRMLSPLQQKNTLTRTVEVPAWALGTLVHMQTKAKAKASMHIADSPDRAERQRKRMRNGKLCLCWHRLSHAKGKREKTCRLLTALTEAKKQK